MKQHVPFVAPLRSFAGCVHHPLRQWEQANPKAVTSDELYGTMSKTKDFWDSPIRENVFQHPER